jgi:hypothetical protein
MKTHAITIDANDATETATVALSARPGDRI